MEDSTLPVGKRKLQRIGTGHHILDILFTESWRTTGIYLGLIFQSQPRPLVSWIRKATAVLPTDMVVLGAVDSGLVSTLCGRENHSICCTRSVDSGRSGIFQNRDGLDRLRFNGGKRLLHPVHQYQRTVIIKRSDPPDTCFSTLFTRLPTFIHDRKPRSHALQCQSRVGHRPLLYLLTRDRADGPGDIGTALGSESDNHHLIHRSHSGDHDDIQPLLQMAVVYLNRLWFIADIREDNHFSDIHFK